MSDGLLFVIFVLLCGLAVLVFAVLPALAIEFAACDSKALAMKVERSWGPLQGCMIRHKGQWVPLDRFRVVD